jgi:XTP/dITP diphosphohydrolase
MPEVTPAESAAFPKLEELIATLHQLRAPGGCVWDREQTHQSLVQYLIEETHELVEAIEVGSKDDLIEELGDVLYQVLFHADLASETEGERFGIEEVAQRMTAKMVSRHPHVFGDQTTQDALDFRSGADVVAVWDELKKADKPNRTSVLDGIPQGMPSLALATKLVGRARKIGVLVDALPDAALPATALPDAVLPATALPDAVLANTAPRDASLPDEQPRVKFANALPATGQPLFADEIQLGTFLLATVANATTQGFDAERALRTALRTLQTEIRTAEINSSEINSSEISSSEISSAEPYRPTELPRS